MLLKVSCLPYAVGKQPPNPWLIREKGRWKPWDVDEHVLLFLPSIKLNCVFSGFVMQQQWRSKGPAGPATAGAGEVEGAHQGAARKK